MPEITLLKATILMPCLNEAETLARCIQKARIGLAAAGVEGEILIADNGSTDGSIEIAESLGARVVRVAEKGYGNALRAGIESACSDWVVMGDADDSYDFSDIRGFVEKLREGDDLVMGCRLPIGGGSIAPGAMPWKNRWLGNPALSFIGRLFFKSPAHDFHCGLRAITRQAFHRLQLKTTGMEFASEMVVKACLKSLRIAEVPITLHPDGRSRRPHLRPWRDGWRHLRFMLIFSPRWLFLVPGLALFGVGLLMAALILVMPLQIGATSLDVGTMLVSAMFAIIGMQLISLGCFAKLYGTLTGLLPENSDFSKVLAFFRLETGLAAGGSVLFLGLALLGYSFFIWAESGFGPLSYVENLKRLISASTMMILGAQVVSSSFFLSVLRLNPLPSQRP